MRRIVLLSLLLSACATTPSVVQRPAAVDAHRLYGPGRGVVAASDEVLLLAPLGQVVARITSGTQGVTLEAEGKTHVAQDAETLTQDLLGWQLPLSGLRYWIAALPAPGDESRREHDAAGRLSVLYQHGWTIRYTRYAGEGRDALPLRLSMRRAGMEVRVLIDEWEAR